MNDLSALIGAGFPPSLLRELSVDDLTTLRVGRVIRAVRALLRLWTPTGEHPALLGPHARDRDDPVVVGDWVLARDGDPLVVERRLPRLSTLSRRDPAGGTQVLASHVDVAWICTSLGRDVNPRRVQRFLALCADAGVEPVIVLTKADAGLDPSEAVAALAATGAPVRPISVRDELGVDALLADLGPGRTVAMLGTSGVGKSTLANRLLGQEAQAVGGIREEDGRGRHTTSARRLLRLPGGAWLLDNPGVRAVGVLEGSGVDATFPEVAEAATTCTFRDCAHEDEPGCALREGVAAGELDAERVEAWLKLQRELAWEAARHDPAGIREERLKWKRIHKAARAMAALRGR